VCISAGKIFFFEKDMFNFVCFVDFFILLLFSFSMHELILSELGEGGVRVIMLMTKRSPRSFITNLKIASVNIN